VDSGSLVDSRIFFLVDSESLVEFILSFLSGGFQSLVDSRLFSLSGGFQSFYLIGLSLANLCFCYRIVDPSRPDCVIYAINSSAMG
jgi:hypothetical protein